MSGEPDSSQLDDGELDNNEEFGPTPVKSQIRGQGSQTIPAGYGSASITSGSYLVASPTAAGPGSRTNSFGQAGGAVLSQANARQAALRSTGGAPAPGPARQSALHSQQPASTLPALNAHVTAAARAARQPQEHLPPLANASLNTGRSGNVLQSPLVSQRPGNKPSYSEKEARLRQGLDLQVKKNNLLSQLGKKQSASLQVALADFEERLSREKEEARAAELTLIERAQVELLYLEYHDRIWAILKEGGRAPFIQETKEDVAQRRRKALQALQATFSELGLDEKGESTRFSTNNERYVALKDPLTPELMESRARAKEWAHELDIPARLGFDDKTMSTVRKYVVPPAAVHDVVVAFFLLFGEHEADTRDWKYCRKLLNPYGGSPGAAAASTQEQQGGLREKIDRFDITTVNPEIAAMAKEILQPYSLAEICKVSECVGPFYLWAQSIIELLEEDGKLATLPTPEEMIKYDPGVVQAAKDELAQKNPTTIDPQPDSATLRRVWRSRRQRLLLESIRARFNILNEKTLSQLRVYRAPPEPVHEAMKAFFLLLGVGEDSTRNWKNVRKLLEPVPKDAQPITSKTQKGVLRPKSWLELKLDSFRADQVDGEIAAMAKEILDFYKLERVRKLNEAVVPFYLWSRKALNDIEANGNMATLAPQDTASDPDGSVRYANLLARQNAILRPKLGGEGGAVSEVD